MAKKIRNLNNLNLENKIVVVRSNLDVSMENGEIADPLAIKHASETIKFLKLKNSKVIIIGHLGDPMGQYKDELSLMPIRFALGNELGVSIKFADIQHCENSIKFMEFGEVLMLENLKFNPEEESEDSEVRISFIKKLADIGDFYVNDDFATQKQLASTYELPKLMKSVIGLQVQKELEKLEEFKSYKSKNYTVIMGGTYKEIKTQMLLNNMEKINNILVGGEIAYDFFAAMGYKIKGYEAKKDRLKTLKEVIKSAKTNKVELILPVDHMIAATKNAKIEGKEIDKGSDIGKDTIKKFSEIIENSDKILMHGPMGEYKVNGFDNGTREILETIVFNTSKDAITYTCGKAMIKVINKFKIKTKRFTHISTSGDLMLNFLGEEKNPNLEVLL